MIYNPHHAFLAKCMIRNSGGTYTLTFFCELCSRSYTTAPIHAQTPQAARRLIEPEAKLHFNLCRKCWRWVCDEHFNENREMCVKCAPRICASCGANIAMGEQFCRLCGKAQYETIDERIEKNE